MQPFTPVTVKMQIHWSAVKEGERGAKEDELMEMHRLNLLFMRGNTEADRRQSHKEQRASCKLMQMIGTTSALTTAAWVGQEPTIEGLCKWQVEDPQEEEQFTPPKQQ